MPDQRVTISDIARRLGITLSAVSNWRRRHPSFPSMEEINGHETFLVDEVANWLDNRTILKRDLRPNELPGTTYGTRFRRSMAGGRGSEVAVPNALWREMSQLRGAEDVGEFADLVLGLLYVATTEERDWNDIVSAVDSHRFRIVIGAFRDRHPALQGLDIAHDSLFGNVRGEGRLAEIVQLIERVRRSGLGPHVFEFLFDQFMAAEGRRGAEMHTPSTVAQLLVELLAPAHGDTVLDPCCGSGAFLLSAAKYLLEHGGHSAEASFIGYSLSERSASQARMNMRIHGVDSDIRVRRDPVFQGGGVMLAADERATVVLSNPPFDLKEPASATSELHGRYGSLPGNRTSFVWLQYVLSTLEKGGRAAVVMPVGTLFREGAEKRVRANILDDRVVEAVIQLPPQMFASTGIPVAVWLLRSDAQARDEILVIDATDLGTMISRTRRVLSSKDEHRILDTVARWRASDGYEDSPGFSASVTLQRVRDQDYVLTPARYIDAAASPNAPSRSVRELREELVRLERHAATVDAAAEKQLDRIETWTL